MRRRHGRRGRGGTVVVVVATAAAAPGSAPTSAAVGVVCRSPRVSVAATSDGRGPGDHRASSWSKRRGRGPGRALPRRSLCASSTASREPCATSAIRERAGLPAVATSNAINANDTARMTHQFGRPRARRGRRPSVDPIPSATARPRYARAIRSVQGSSGANATAARSRRVYSAAAVGPVRTASSAME